MRFSLLQENLATALTHVSRFVAAKSQLPILNNILITFQDNRLKLSATNLELGINYWLAAKIEEEGSITVPAKELTEFVSYLPTGKIDVFLGENNLLTVKSFKAESTFASALSTDYPSLPSLEESNRIELELNTLIETISQVSFSAATDDSRPVLTAVLWQITATGYKMVATDGFRLSIKNGHFKNPLSLKKDEILTFLVPARSLAEVVKLSKNASTLKCGPTSDGHQFLFVVDDVELVTRLIEGDFPDYQRIIPDGSNTTVTLDKDEFAASVKMCSVFARESANVVKLKIGNNQLELSASTPQVGQNRVEVEAKVDGPPLEIAFNYKFLTDFLAISKGKQITLELNQPLTPGLFKDISDPDFFHIIMPVRIQD